LKDRNGNMDIVKFYYLMNNNLSSSETLTDNKGHEKAIVFKMEDEIE
jgi:hypothetical protein